MTAQKWKTSSFNKSKNETIPQLKDAQRRTEGVGLRVNNEGWCVFGY